MATCRSTPGDMDCGKTAGNERPNFSQTCSLLSQYLKEKGTFGDLGLCIFRGTEETGAPEMLRPTATPTMNFLMMDDEKPADVPRGSMKPLDLFHRQIRKEDSSKMADASGTTQKQPPEAASQMTIFYAGQVMVFSDFPAEKVKEIMLLASKASMLQNPRQPGLLKVSHNPIQDRIQRPADTIVTDLPIARRASLHRFLEKRKDRITAKSPYPAAAPDAPAPKPSDGKTWLGLSAQPTQ